jgi:hypothetical protein
MPPSPISSTSLLTEILKHTMDLLREISFILAGAPTEPSTPQ